MVSGRFSLLEIRGPLTYFSLSLRFFRVSHKILPTDASNLPRWESVSFRLSHSVLFVTDYQRNPKHQILFFLNSVNPC